jgi:hypothetical protein
MFDGVVKMKKMILIAGMLMAASSFAKLPAPSEEAKAKADEAKAKTAWSDKVAAFQLCKAQDRVAAGYLKAKGTAAGVSPVATPACADPGAYVSPVAAVAVAPAVAPTAATTPATTVGANK